MLKDDAITVSRQFSFDYAHRIAQHAGKCRNLHGHRGVATVTCQLFPGEKLDGGMVCDFGEIKAFWGPKFDQWDHACLFDQIGDDALGEFADKRYGFFGPPSVENMLKEAWRWAHEFHEQQKHPGPAAPHPYRAPVRVEVVRIRIQESPDTWAEADGGLLSPNMESVNDFYTRIGDQEADE